MGTTEIRAVLDALKRVTSGARLVSPAGEPWRSAALELPDDGAVPLVDLHTAMPHSSRVELAKRVLGTVAGEQLLAVIERSDAPSMAPDLPVVAVVPSVTGRLRMGRRSVRALLDRLATGDAAAAEIALLAAGDAVWPELRASWMDLVEPRELDPRWAALRLLGASTVPIGWVFDVFFACGHHALPEYLLELSRARWPEAREDLVERLAASTSEQQRSLLDLLYTIIFDGAERSLPVRAEPVLLQALRSGVSSHRAALLLIAHGWAVDEALGAITPVVQRQLAEYDGGYDDEIELSTVAYVVRGVRSDAALDVLAMIDERASGNLLASVARALETIATPRALQMLHAQLQRVRSDERLRDAAGPDPFVRGIEAQVLCCIATAEGGSASATFQALWDMDGGVFVDLQLSKVLPEAFDESPERVLSLLEAALRGGPHLASRAERLVDQLGPAAAPLAGSITQSELRPEERDLLLFQVTRDVRLGRALLASDPSSARNAELRALAHEDARSGDDEQRRLALAALEESLGRVWGDPLYLAFRDALEPIRSS